MGGFLAPTATDLPSSPELQEMEQPFSSFQSLQESNSSLESIWPAFNISDTDGISGDSSVAVDFTGNVHFVWVESIGAGRPEIFYAVWNIQTERLSQIINVSNSPSAFSTMSQFVVDNVGNAHIVWGEDDTSDSDVLYSKCESENNQITCSTPVNLSGPPDRQCGGNTNPWPDLNSGNPTIGIDGVGNLMVVWTTYEYFWQITQPYSTWNINDTPPSRSTGCAPFGGSISEPYRLVEGHRVMGETSGGFQLVFTSRNINYPAGVYYSQFENGSWSSPTVITIEEGAHPDIFLDNTNQAHVTVCDDEGQLQYWNSNNQTLEDVLGNYPSAGCEHDSPVVVDTSRIAHIFWGSDTGKVYLSKRDSGVWSEPQIVNDGGSLQGVPDAVISNVNDNEYIHVVWQDQRDGGSEIYYSFSYSCDRIEPATDAGKAVLNALENTDYLYYCKNQVEEVIYVPAPNGQDDPNEAFQEWADLAKSAQNEVAFTVMFWDKDNGSELRVPGEDVLAGIDQLHDEVIKEENESKYPRGMRVRILLGVQFNTINLDSPAPGTDQRFNVLEQMQELDIPIYEILSNGSEWKVEVALYDFGLGSGLPPGIHSHVKLMVVDNNKMIVSGYHPQYGFQTNATGDASNHDLGIKVSGPIAANGMAVFDSLWEGSEILCTEEDVALFDIIILIGWGSCHTKIGENPAHWPFKPTGDDIVLPLYRDHNDKTADVAVQDAIKSASQQIYILQNRFGVPGFYYPFPYFENGLLGYANGILNNPNNPIEVRIIVSQDSANRRYNVNSIVNFLDLYENLYSERDIFRFYAPNGYTRNPPGLHTKSFMIDEEFLVIGSQNFDHSAFGSNDNDLDLVEYSIGIESESIISDVANSENEEDEYFETIWNNSGRAILVRQGESLEDALQEAQAGDVILIEKNLEEDIFEISTTLNISDGITIAGEGVTIVPSSNFSSESTLKLASPSWQTTPSPLLRITGDNVSLIGLTLQDSSGYAIEIEDGVENAYISNIVFENNALGGVHVSSNTTYTIENNTFISGSSGVTIASNANATGLIRNNIFTEQTIAPIEITSSDDGTVEYSYNLFDECDLGTCTTYWHIGDLSISSNAHDNLFDLDPLFVNPSNGEYQLLANSPAIDAGDPSILHEFLFDGDGDDELRIDIGAHEYMGESSNEPTPTASQTPTQTPSETPTPTVTPTFTPSPTNTPTFTPSPTFTPVSDLIFADSFESGNFNAWGWATTDGGDLSVSTQSAAVGTYGMQALLDDSAEILVYDHTPNNETHYSARFYFDPNNVQSPNDGFYLMALSSNAGWVGCVYLEQQGNDYYSLNLCGKNDAGNWLETESVLIADEWQAIELEWKAATSSGANNGYIKLYIGDELATSIENIDNDTHSITTTSLGVLDTPTGASGIVYFDEFESRTGSYIGLHPNAPSVNPAPTRPDALFADDFEGNNLNAWNPTLTKIDFGDLSTSSGSAYQSDYGLQALIDDIVVLRAIDSSPADESQYRARFYFHPNSLTMNNNTAHFIFDGYDTDADDYLFRLELLYENGSYKLRPRIMKDNYATTNGSKYTISNAWHSIEIEWKKATAVGANNGYLSLWIDGTLVGTISNVDNDLWTLDFVQLGATAGIDSTTSGSMLFDNFVSRRYTYIGQ
jgi:phosphatidylserine/phosphatidylglycerophosphate/cardiolipin synthase-like enzyme